MSDAAKKITVNRVLLLLVVLALLAVALPFINYAPNRLVSGEGRQLWEIWPATIWMLTGAGCALFTLCFVPGKRGSVLTLMMAQTLFIVMLWGVRRGDLFKITVIRCDLTESVVIQGDRRKRLSR